MFLRRLAWKVIAVYLVTLTNSVAVAEIRSPTPVTSESAGPLVLQVPHRRTITSVVVSLDGKTVITASWDGSIKFWDARTGEIKQTLPNVIEGLGCAVALSPDGRKAAVGPDPFSFAASDVKVWDVQTGKLLQKLPHDLFVSSIEFSHDGQTLVTATQRKGGEGLTNSQNKSKTDKKVVEKVQVVKPAIRVWDIATFKLRHTLPLPAGAFDGPSYLAYSASNNLLASAYGSTITLWNAQTGKRLRNLALPKTQITALKFSPDGKTLAGGFENKTVDLWEAPSWRLKRRIKMDDADVRAIVAASPTAASLGMVVVGKETQEVMWRMVKNDSGPVIEIVFSPDSANLACALGHQASFIKLCDVVTGKVRRRFVRREGDLVASLAFSPDSKSLVSGGGGLYEMFHPSGLLRLWDIQSGHLNWSATATAQFSNPLAVSPSGAIVVAAWSGDYITQLWTVNGWLLHTLKGTSVADIAFSPDEKLVALGGLLGNGKFSGGGIQIWNMAQGRLIKTLKAREYGIDAISFSPDGKTIAGVSEALRLWNVATGKVERSVKTTASSIAFSPDGKFLATIGDRENSDRVILWNAHTLKKVWTVGGKQWDGGKIAFSPDGQKLAHIDVDMKVHVRDVRTGKEQSPKLIESGIEGTSVTFLSQGEELQVVGANGTLTYWDMKTNRIWQSGKELNPNLYHTIPPVNGTHLVSAAGSSLQFWNAQDGQLVAKSEVLRFTTSPKGTSTTWITYTPQSYYYGSNDIDRFIRWKIDNQLYPANKLKPQFLRPDLVKFALTGQ